MAKRTDTQQPLPTEPKSVDVARRAYEFYEARGGQPGADLDDWLRAEQELRGLRSRIDHNLAESPPKRTRRTAQVTSTPEPPAPRLLCPRCDQPLIYRETVIGGLRLDERWDYFDCRHCGPFVYRARSRRLRPVVTFQHATRGAR